MLVLDTDILTLLFAGHPRVMSRRDRVPSGEIAITVVSQIQSLQLRFSFLLKAATGTKANRPAQFNPKRCRHRTPKSQPPDLVQSKAVPPPHSKEPTARSGSIQKRCRHRTRAPVSVGGRTVGCKSPPKLGLNFVTEGNCAVARRGGEQPEVND